MISGGEGLLTRLCNDQNDEDGFVRLVPEDGRELVEFTRSGDTSVGLDLKVLGVGVNAGGRTGNTEKYARTVPGDVVQTFRNYVDAIVTHQVKRKMGRDGLLILLDEFDVIKNKSGMGSLIKSLTSPELKFAICGIGQDLTDLVTDHASVERLLEEGAVHVLPMDTPESEAIFDRAEALFQGALQFDRDVVEKVADLCQGYPYFAQLLGKECVSHANRLNRKRIGGEILDLVLSDIQSGRAFPTLEASYQRAIGNSPDRELLLHLLAGQSEDNAMFNSETGRVVLRETRRDADDLEIQYIDQLVPRLVDEAYGPVLKRIPERQGIYEFVNPVLRLYIRLRRTR